jgi:hypothetical protein
MISPHDDIHALHAVVAVATEVSLLIDCTLPLASLART